MKIQVNEHQMKVNYDIIDTKRRKSTFYLVKLFQNTAIKALYIAILFETRQFLSISNENTSK